MTVCVAIKVHDCIVFAADSAVSLTTTSSSTSLVSNLWKHGIKVFNLHRKLPIVAMTAGMANFGSMSITNLSKDLRIKLEEEMCCESYTLEEVANSAKLHFQQEYTKISVPPADPSSFEFWIGGYGSSAEHGEIWKIAIVNGQSLEPVQLVSTSTSNQVLWGGQVQAISRLLLGCDPRLNEFLKVQQLNANQLQQLNSELAEIQTPLVHPSMPVQDAINLADFLVDLTKRYVAFMPQADTVGGDTDIATVTKHEGFKWIRRKHYYSHHLNRRETDHVT